MDQVQIPPQVGKYSVYIIDEVHMLSTAAFNAFLKTLEEPPAHAIFILATTEKHKILPTILSRCQTYDFNRISIPDMVFNLRNIANKENVKIDDESLHVIAQKADGAMRDALTIFDQTVAFCGSDIKYEDVIRNLNVLDYEYSFDLVDDFLAGDYGKALLTFDDILSKGFNALHFCSALSSHLRDLMVARNGGLDALLELPESLKKRYAEQASRCSLKFLYDALGVTTACETGYKTAINPRLHIEFALMKLSFLMKAPGMADQGGNDAKAESGPSAPLRDRTENSPSTPLRDRLVSGAEPRTRKKPTKTGSALSLNAIMEEEENKKKKEEVTSQEVSDKLPDDEVIRNAWKAIPEEFKAMNQIRLANTLQNAEIEIEASEGMKTVKFKVSNEAQRKWIQENRLLSLEGNLQKKTGSSKIRLEVGVIPMEEKEIQPYTDQEKATALMGQNGEIQNLVKDFGLETK